MERAAAVEAKAVPFEDGPPELQFRQKKETMNFTGIFSEKEITSYPVQQLSDHRCLRARAPRDPGELLAVPLDGDAQKEVDEHGLRGKTIKFRNASYKEN